MNAAPRTKASARAASLTYAESFVPETAHTAAARLAARQADVATVSQGVASALAFLADAIKAKAIVEVGTGTGVSGLSLLEGMVADGILTTIDVENGMQLAARKAFADAGIPTRRARLITGAALAVLPKLSDGAYDLVFVDGDPLEYVEYVAQGLRLLRHGGVLVLHHVLWSDTVADPMDESDETLIMREALDAISETEEFRPLLLPLGDGLVAAIKA
ncbi:MAG: class I SAM-dependent methyltransferase [Propionibacteriaceae bacterium]|nr:class I SAM-dependent methyltransferase [Micropruina sp.]HBX80927.1 methyltransferase [Propionibacteriaceae bacterium]HBY22570.1 methyltransferase [Propionibacteriaceae bacterium]